MAGCGVCTSEQTQSTYGREQGVGEMAAAQNLNPEFLGFGGTPDGP